MSYAGRLRRELKTRCLHLCTKAATYPLPDDAEQPNPHDTAIWWCGKTTEALGPDDSAADAEACGGPGRECYLSPVPPA